MRMRRIPAGRFLMGASEDDALAYDDEMPQREVTITYPFWICEFPITQELYSQYMQDMNPSYYSHAANLPVEKVRWHQAAAFANALSRSEGLPCAFEEVKDGFFRGVGNGTSDYLASRGYRLPTEAEWEYAARAGSPAPYYGDLDEIAWHFGNSKEKTQPVGLKKPNDWGLYDMLGNVYEWCYDEYHANYRETGTQDPLHLDGGAKRVIRGGSWYSSARIVRSAFRNASYAPTFRSNALGFRLVIR